MHRCFTGSTGAEDLALARLASSLEHSTPIAPMPLFRPSVQPVLHLIFIWSSEAYRLVPKARPSDHPTTIGCIDAYSIGSSGATEVSLSWFLWLGFLHGLFNSTPIFSLSSLEPKSLRMVILTIILVPLIALSFDHQNHSKWHKWCHVRFSGGAETDVVEEKKKLEKE